MELYDQNIYLEQLAKPQDPFATSFGLARANKVLQDGMLSLPVKDNSDFYSPRKSSPAMFTPEQCLAFLQQARMLGRPPNPDFARILEMFGVPAWDVDEVVEREVLQSLLMDDTTSAVAGEHDIQQSAGQLIPSSSLVLDTSIYQQLPRVNTPAADVAGDQMSGLLVSRESPAIFPNAGKTRAIRHCSVAGCSTKVQSKGKCKKHGGGTRCCVPLCPKAVQSNGRCRDHGGGKRCVVESCKKWAQRKGYCHAHRAMVVAKKSKANSAASRS